jgi:hypothetical protein
LNQIPAQHHKDKELKNSNILEEQVTHMLWKLAFSEVRFQKGHNLKPTVKIDFQARKVSSKFSDII